MHKEDLLLIDIDAVVWALRFLSSSPGANHVSQKSEQPWILFSTSSPKDLDICYLRKVLRRIRIWHFLVVQNEVPFLTNCQLYAVWN